jgi:DNA-directed RNA polymerase subunit RPC12/RpoP
MGDFVTLTCPTCGGKLQITPYIDRFACTHCGNEHLVKRSEGVIAIQPLAESLTGLKRATDRTASEMALRRLSEELARLGDARLQAQGKVEECQQALRERERARRKVLWDVITVVPVLVLVFLWPLPFQLSGQIGPLSAAHTEDLIVWLIPPAVVTLISALVIRHRLAAPALKKRREQIQADLAAAQESLHGVDEAISSVNAEQSHHRELVSL